MPAKKKTNRGGQVDADDPLFRALRQVADEALEEEIPERLLRLIRKAHKPQDESESGNPPAQKPSKVDETG